RFLGVECTYGDDRALTNRVIRAGWTTRYDARAEAWTDAPDRYRKFFRQQLRWKKSWSREGPLLLAHVWRSRTRALPSIAVQTLAGLLSPIVVVYSLVTPVAGGRFPMVYFLGLYLVSMGYALTYRMLRDDGMWSYAFVGTFFYVMFSPQLLWAIARIRDGKWGTRDAATPGRPSAPGPRPVRRTAVRAGRARGTRAGGRVAGPGPGSRPADPGVHRPDVPVRARPRGRHVGGAEPPVRPGPGGGPGRAAGPGGTLSRE